MPITGKLEKATLTEMWPGGPNNALTIKGQNGPEKIVKVQFNPQTLKLSFSNQNAGGNQSGGSPTQFAGQGTTKLSLELWFDVTLPRAGGADPEGDVRNLTKEVAYFMSPQKLKDGSGFAPPGVQFQWGTFLFKGTVDSMEETLDLFSEDGKPLRAGVTLSLSKQDLNFDFHKPDPAAAAAAAAGTPGAGGGPAAGTQPLSMAKSGDTVQGMAAAGGVSDWKAVAIANGIENPRRMSPGALLNVSGSLSGSGAASLGLTGGTAATMGAASGVSIGGGMSGSTAPSVAASASGSIRVEGSGSGSSGLSASSSLRFTGPLGPSR
ncbi:peptidoglycan-binding protein [Longimicrobium sp.]|uniref:CIS tube protein n=1 Tax=Longimicrobium sp. TaxID=2029185 RepID=UPI003B3AB2F0